MSPLRQGRHGPQIFLRMTSMQEETEYEEIATSILPHIATVAPHRNAIVITGNTGNYPVATTAFSKIVATDTIPDPTNTAAAAHQDATNHTPSQNAIINKKTVEMKSARRAIEKVTRNTEE